MTRTKKVLAAVGLALGLALANASAAHADSPRIMTGACEPIADVVISSGTVYFSGYTDCSLPLSYTLQIMYNKINGESHASNQKVCTPGPNQHGCGFTGVTGTMRNTGGRYCVNTVINKPNSSGRSTPVYSLAKCING